MGVGLLTGIGCSPMPPFAFYAMLLKPRIGVVGEIGRMLMTQ